MSGLVLDILELEVSVDHITEDVLLGNRVYGSRIQKWDLDGNRKQAAVKGACI